MMDQLLKIKNEMPDEPAKTLFEGDQFRQTM